MVIFGGHVSRVGTNAQHALHINVAYDFNSRRLFELLCVIYSENHDTGVERKPAKLHSGPKQATNDKLQGSVATYLRCGGVVNQIKKGLLLSLWVKKTW